MGTGLWEAWEVGWLGLGYALFKLQLELKASLGGYMGLRKGSLEESPGNILQMPLFTGDTWRVTHRLTQERNLNTLTL